MAKGLKINNNNSSVKPKENTSASFEKVADETFERNERYKSSIRDLSQKFKSIIEDKTLVVNKSHIAKDVEEEVIKKLASVATEMNADDTQPEGFGSIALSFLTLKILLSQRDNINNLAFKLENAEKYIAKLEEKLLKK